MSIVINSSQIINADADQMSEHYARTLKPAKVTPIDLKRGISVDDQHCSIGDYDVWCGKCSSGMQVEFLEPSDAYALYLPVSGAMDVDVGRKRLTSTPSVRIVGNMSSFERLTIHKERSHIGIAFDNSAFTGLLSELLDGPVVKKLDFFTTIERKKTTGATLFAMGDVLWNYLNSKNGDTISLRTINYYCQSIMLLLIESVPNNYSKLLAGPISPALPKNMKRAIDYMVANIAEPINMTDIAREAGTSVRALQLAFQQFKGTTPTKYLLQLRLEGVRRSLAEETKNMPITQIAQKWGFTHMGRFSENYYRAFGQNPLETATISSRRHFRP